MLFIFAFNKFLGEFDRLVHTVGEAFSCWKQDAEHGDVFDKTEEGRRLFTTVHRKTAQNTQRICRLSIIQTAAKEVQQKCLAKINCLFLS